ncbi:MAG: undecaprenyl-phosphate glucose phosphotransferase, partial [Muribaculaceae bacterium]|nr:undecaprenyl-phosphate glucose phosphotransferase [Muribaculaceae bacterium]
KTFGRFIKPALMVGDWLLIVLFFILTLYIFRGIDLSTATRNLLWLLVNISFIPVAIREWNLGDNLRAIQLDRVMVDSLRSVGLHALFFLSLITLTSIVHIPARFFFTYYGMLIAAQVLWSLLSRRLIKSYRRRGYNYKRVVIVGTNATARRLYDGMLSDTGFGYKILGFFDKDWRPDFVGRYCGTLDNLESFVKKNRIDQIYYTMPGHAEILTKVVKIADDNVVDFFYVPQISQYISRSFQMETIGPVPVLNLRRNPLKKAINRSLKRGFDIVFSSVVLLFYPLVFIPVAAVIKLTSPGPIYFKQKRTGYRGREFYCYKFRTMHVNADADRAQATKDDPRKTRFGDFLRRSSIDEIPQFINVLKGDMSVVGPRPHMLKHTEEYSKIVDQYMVRHLVKPGITGWAQVNGYRGLTDEVWKMEKRVEYDVWYIENWSFVLDLKIIVRTVLNAIGGESNAF